MTAEFITPEKALPLLSWPEAVAALEAGHRLAPPEQGDILLGDDAGRLLCRAARIQGLGMAIKGDSIFPQNAEKGLPSIHGGVMLYHAQTGALRAVIDSHIVTQYKTAADSLLGAKCLARPESRRLLIIGAGVVAETLAQAYLAAFPALETITFWARREAQAEALAARLAGLPVTLEVSRDLPADVARADIISAATMAKEPVLKGEWVSPGTHIDLIGAYTPEMREADDALIASARVYVDFRDTVVDRIGEILAPLASGAITPDHIKGDLYDLVAAGGPSRASDDEITLFKNGGGAHLDLMIADYVARKVAQSR